MTKLYYYIHPESSSAWVSTKFEEIRDPCVEEVSEETWKEYCEHEEIDWEQILEDFEDGIL